MPGRVCMATALLPLLPLKKGPAQPLQIKLVLRIKLVLMRIKLVLVTTLLLLRMAWEGLPEARG